MAPQFCDISVFNPTQIDWIAYKKWAAQWDGTSRVAMRSSYGTGYADDHFATYRAEAIKAGIDMLLYYHYSYPQFNQASAEADWQHQVVGDIRPQDMIVLDYEEGFSQATAAWAYEWLSRQEQNYGGKLPAIYASDSYIRQRLQDSRLARYPLWLANWQYTPDERPPCPPPWTQYQWVQYTDQAANIPGVGGLVDADIYLGATGPDYQRQEAVTIWKSGLPGLAFTTGIASAWLTDYRKGVFHGPPLSPEIHTTDWAGNPNIIQIFPGGQFEWRNGATFYRYQ